MTVKNLWLKYVFRSSADKKGIKWDLLLKNFFEELPSACFGVVMAKGIDNNNAYPEIEQFLDESIQAAMQRFEGRKVKEDPDILPYREAFRALNILSNIVLNELDWWVASQWENMPTHYEYKSRQNFSCAIK